MYSIHYTVHDLQTAVAPLLHSAFLKMFVAPWHRIDFDIFLVKIWVLIFPTTISFWHIICLTLLVFHDLTLPQEEKSNVAERNKHK